jgi:omega-6 fatty acid desaturase (delta-12 desaturase)
VRLDQHALVQLGPDNLRSTLQLATTLLLYIFNWVACLEAARSGLALLAVPAMALQALLSVRIFNIQHDCAHRSYFTRRLANDMVGSALAFATLTSHAYWRRHHLTHHATSGDLDRRGDGDIMMWTVREYTRAGAFARLRYRLYRHPAVFLLLGPIYYFMIKMRIPWIAPPHSLERRSIHISNAMVVAPYVVMGAAGGPWQLLAVLHFAVMLPAGAVGVWLFFVQHQFEGTAWQRASASDLRGLALDGSSNLRLGPFLEWMFVHINIHHVHHLHPSLPNYNLRPAMHRLGLDDTCGVSLGAALRAFRLKLWDEAAGRLVRFPGVRL